MSRDDELIFEVDESGSVGSPAGVVLNLDVRNLDHGIRWFFAGRVEVLRQAARATAQRGVEYAKRLAKREGLVYLQGYVDAFQSKVTPDGAMLLNDAPYAHVLEYGRRPGRPGPPLEPIADWAEAKLGNRALGWPIRKKIHEEGTRPYFVMARTSQQMELWYRLEVKRRLGLR